MKIQRRISVLAMIGFMPIALYPAVTGNWPWFVIMTFVGLELSMTAGTILAMGLKRNENNKPSTQRGSNRKENIVIDNGSSVFKLKKITTTE
jgi:hypothetical protein